MIVFNNAKTIYNSVADVVGEKYVTDQPSALFAYTKDASAFGGTEGSLLVRPGTTEEVSRIMTAAYENSVPVVVRGSGASAYTGNPKGFRAATSSWT